MVAHAFERDADTISPPHKVIVSPDFTHSVVFWFWFSFLCGVSSFRLVLHTLVHEVDKGR
jgi:hypothetical protein